MARSSRSWRFPQLGALIALPFGSQVHLELHSLTWTPDWASVQEDADLVPYKQLRAAVAALEAPLTQQRLAQATANVQGHVLRWNPPVQANSTRLPPPVLRPSAPEFGSLTGYLQGTPIARQAIRTALASRHQPAPAPLLAPPLGANPGLVGIAFDYAFRFLLEGVNPTVVPVKRMLVARRAALELDHDRTLAAVEEAEMILGEVAQGLPVEVRHAHAAVVLASYEVVARTGRFLDLAGLVPTAAQEDVLALIQAVPRGLFQAQTQLILNPGFPAAGRFGGADADVLLDDLLIEVKATRHLRLKGEYLQQLTGYLVLDRLAGTVGSTVPLRRLGVYYARHGVLQVFPVKDAYRPGLLPQLVSWFDESLPGT